MNQKISRSWVCLTMSINKWNHFVLINIACIFLFVAGSINGCDRKGKRKKSRKNQKKQPLSIHIPSGWDLAQEYEETNCCYKIETTNQPKSLLMISEWPAPVPDGLNTLINRQAEKFVEKTKEEKMINLSSKTYEIKGFSGNMVEGKYVIFQFAGKGKKMLQIMFMLKIGDLYWRGQFTGSKSDWKQALKILRKIRIN